ncbi:MAG: SelB domain-containing protein, partial [Mycobacteriales bacterium]
RWAEERRRGMTIDLGYAWTDLPSGEVIGFVDVPGHQRFIGNMLAGLGPSPAVLFVVAADEGWRRQSQEHLAAVEALGVERGLLAVTRSDLADPAPAVQEALGHLAATSLGAVEAVTVSGATGEGLDRLRAALDRLVAAAPPPDLAAPVRLWLDRSFTVRGAGTVVTGTLSAGRLAVGDELELDGRRVQVRGLQSRGTTVASVDAVARVAVNLRGVEREAAGRGRALLAPGAWRGTDVVDVRLTRPGPVPPQLVLHVGTAAVAVRTRPLDEAHVRLQLGTPLPLRAGDRAVLRDPAAQLVLSGALVLDPDPPSLRRRGAAAGRAGALSTATAAPDLAAEVARRGAVERAVLERLGVGVHEHPDVREVGDWLVAESKWTGWTVRLQEAVDTHAADRPLEAGLPEEAARRAAGLPAPELLAPLVTAAGLERHGGRVRRPGAVPALGVAEAAVQQVEARLAADPFAPPDLEELAALRLGPRELAAAEGAGRLVRLTADVVLLPDGPARAMRVLAALPQPFTTSAARQALGTTRRVAVPLLEHLDGRGWT